MFVSINIYFRPYEFLYSSLSFFESKGSIHCIKKCHFDKDKKVLVARHIFGPQNVLKNDLQINVCQSIQSCVNGVCTPKKAKLYQTVIQRHTDTIRKSSMACIF